MCQWHTNERRPSRQARLRGRRPLLCSAARGAVRNAKQKKPCQPKTAKRFFGGPGSQGPSGQAKERTRILPVRRGFSAFGVPRRLPGWLFLRGQPLSGLLAFVSGVSAFFCRCAAALVPACGCPPFFCLACAAGACLPFACRQLCSRPADRLPPLRGLLRPLLVCLPCACMCGAIAATAWPVWLAAPGCREVPPSGGCACALPQIGPRSASLFPAHTPPAAFAPGMRVLPPASFVFGLRCPGACLSFVRCAQRAQNFCCFFT